jgi:uracil-DNA glycosylase
MSVAAFLAEARACRVCADLPRGPRPVLRLGQGARLLIVGQAPGIRVHETGIPWNDPSGDRLRRWLGLDRARFYDEGLVAIVPMGLCYPGTDARGGDRPPRPECAPLWQPRLSALLPELRLTLLIGRHAQRWHLGTRMAPGLVETVRAWRDFLPLVPLPHPSGRNNGLLRREPWIEAAMMPALRDLIRQEILGDEVREPGGAATAC